MDASVAQAAFSAAVAALSAVLLAKDVSFGVGVAVVAVVAVMLVVMVVVTVVVMMGLRPRNSGEVVAKRGIFFKCWVKK